MTPASFRKARDRAHVPIRVVGRWKAPTPPAPAFAISVDYLRRVAPWAQELNEVELERSLQGITARHVARGDYVRHRDDRVEFWTGVDSGLLKLSTLSQLGKPVTLLGVRTGGWFGEGLLLKRESLQYDIVALHDTDLVLMDRSTFYWLFNSSVGFNRFLIRQFNERLDQALGFIECARIRSVPARLARNIASLFNPVLYPNAESALELSQEELGLLSGVSRQSANKALKLLEQQALLRVEYGKITVLDLDRLSRYE